MMVSDGSSPPGHGAGSAYLSSATGVLVTRALSLVAGALSLWLLSAMLPPAEFAGYTTAMSALLLFGLGAGFGIERTMLIKIAGLPTRDATLQGAAMMRRIGGFVLLSGSVVGLIAAAMWFWLPGLSGDTPVADWMFRLWPVVPATALTLALVTWYQANHIFGFPQSLWGVSDVMRCTAFAATFALGLGLSAVAFSAIAAAILPGVILISRAVGRTARDPEGLDWRDVGDGLQFFVSRFCAMALIHVDILILSVFAPSPVLAQYVIASRLAAIVETGHQVFAPAYAARARRHIETNAPRAAWREYETARTLGLLVTLLVIAPFLAFGHSILGLFGEFGVAFGPFAILLAGHLLNVAFGNHAMHLSMTRDLPFAAANRIFGLGAFVVLLLLLAPEHQGVGAATAFFLAVLGYNLSGTVIVRVRQGVWIAAPLPMLTTAIAVTFIWLAAVDPSMARTSALVVMGCALTLLVARRALVGSVASEIRALLSKPRGTGR
jgi:O-antigen/teichoic acid export membrane protein